MQKFFPFEIHRSITLTKSSLTPVCLERLGDEYIWQVQRWFCISEWNRFKNSIVARTVPSKVQIHLSLFKILTDSKVNLEHKTILLNDCLCIAKLSDSVPLKSLPEKILLPAKRMNIMWKSSRKQILIEETPFMPT